jgi:hypothetical protein
MKPSKIILAFVICGLGIAQGAAFGQKSSSVFYYPVKSAFIEYAHTGSATGTETWYMDNNGKLSARYTELTEKSFGTTTKTSQVVIQKDSVFYTINLIERTGLKQTVHIDQADIDKWGKNPEEAWTNMGFKKVGDETILGKPCQIWEGMSTKSWIWQNFVLKTQVDLFGKSTVEATKIDIGGAIDKSKFEIPADIKMEESVINANDPVFDSIGKGIERGMKDLKEMFGPKKKK